MPHSLQMKQPRNHPSLEWESKNLTNEFIDISRMALDDRYAKQAAPLSKRRNGIGFTDGSTPGLFGIRNPTNERDAYTLGALVAAATYIVSDMVFFDGENSAYMQKTAKKAPLIFIGGLMAMFALAPTA